MRKVSYRAIVVFPVPMPRVSRKMHSGRVPFLPNGRCHSGDAILGSDLGFVDSNLGKLSSIFVPLKGMSVDTVNIYFTAKVAR